jgi:hypothetical protein
MYRNNIAHRRRPTLRQALLSNQAVVGFIMIVVLTGAIIVLFKVATPVQDVPCSKQSSASIYKLPEAWHPPLLPVCR